MPGVGQPAQVRSAQRGGPSASVIGSSVGLSVVVTVAGLWDRGRWSRIVGGVHALSSRHLLRAPRPA